MDDRNVRPGYRDNTRDEARNNGSPQRVQIVADITGQNQIVQCFLKWGRFRISDFELLSCPMPQFSYRARNAQGELVEGVLDCADRAIAIHQIEQQRCIPIRIEPLGARPETVDKKESTAAPPAATPAENLKIPHNQLLIFTEQLAHLLQAGMTLDEGLSILEKRLKQPRVQQMTRTLHQALVDGRSFSQALREMPRIFPPLFVNLVAA